MPPAYLYQMNEGHSLGKSRVLNFVPPQHPPSPVVFLNVLCYPLLPSGHVAVLCGGHEFVWNTAGSRFTTVRSTTIHFYDPYRVGSSTPDLWYVIVAISPSFLYLMRVQLFSDVHVFLLLFFILVKFFSVDCDFSIRDVHQTDRKGKVKTVDVTFFLDVFWTTAWALFNKIKSDLILFNYLYNFLYT